MAESEKPKDKKKKMNRREFLAGSGAMLAAGTIAAGTPLAANTSSKDSYPESKGYLVYDSKKCIGCTTCMLSCSTVHYGKQSLSLSRIQIIQDSFGKFPDDLQIAPCRQCVTPPCVINCPVGAAYIDTENGNVRRINEEECIGCKTCVAVCPFGAVGYDPVARKVISCDLCDGDPICVRFCFTEALQYVNDSNINRRRQRKAAEKFYEAKRSFAM